MGRCIRAFVTCISEHFRITTIPASVSAERLQGALDINQTLVAGKPIYQSGLLATPDGALLVTGAERLDSLTASVLSAHLDNPEAPDTVLIAMDESTDEEPGLADTAMADRLGMMIELPALPLATLQTLVEQSASGVLTESSCLSILPDDVELDDALLLEIAMLAQRLGVDSLRALLFAVRVARTHAALHQRSQASVEDAAIAAQLVLAPRATSIESAQEPGEDEQQEQTTDDPEDAQPPEEPSNDNDPDLQNDTQEDRQTDDVGERLLEACAATLPQHLIADLVRGQKNNRTAGRDAAATGKGTSGRPTGVRRPRGSIRGQRLNILETLKAAAPKQKLRSNTQIHAQGYVQGKQPGNSQRLQVRSEDFRVTRYKQPTRTTTVFVVDASGSAALHRLAEAKGAVELLLAECYVRRDRVAMISFRGTAACLELPPTRSLVRAKRELAGLPGGGGTPLAAGLDLAAQVVQQLKQAGETPVVVLMTDGKANIARNGEGSRSTAMDDAHAAARQLAATQVRCLFVDTAPRARPQARELARSLQATYLPLPSTNTNMLPELIRG